MEMFLRPILQIQSLLTNALETRDILLFCSALNSIHLLSGTLLQAIRDERKLFGSMLPSDLLIQSYRFLSYSAVNRGLLVCRSWNTFFRSPFAKPLLERKPKLVRFDRSWSTNDGDAFNLHRKMVVLKNQLHLSRPNVAGLTTYSLAGSVVQRALFSLGILSCTSASACDKGLLCSYDETKIQIFQIPNPRAVHGWSTYGFQFTGLCFDEGLVYAAGRSSISVYNKTGAYLRNWSLMESNESRNMAISRGELFLADTRYHCIRVYSLDGIFLREWELNQAARIWSLVLSDSGSSVFVNASPDLYTFTREGTLLFKVVGLTREIACVDDVLYTHDIRNEQVRVGRLVYS